jgi:hypothetical protein
MFLVPFRMLLESARRLKNRGIVPCLADEL